MLVYSLATYVCCVVIAALFGVFYSISRKGFDSDQNNKFSKWSVVCLLFLVFSLTPLFYEYPGVFEDSIVLEKNNGQLIVHRYGMVNLEGTGEVWNVPSKSMLIQITARAGKNSKNLKGVSGYIVVEDYTKLISENFVKTLNKGYMATAEIIDITSYCIDVSLVQVEEPLPIQKIHRLEVINNTVNSSLTAYGLRFTAVDIW